MHAGLSQTVSRCIARACMNVAGEKCLYLLSYQWSKWYFVGHEATSLWMKGWFYLPQCCRGSLFEYLQKQRTRYTVVVSLTIYIIFFLVEPMWMHIFKESLQRLQ